MKNWVSFGLRQQFEVSESVWEKDNIIKFDDRENTEIVA